MVDLQSRICFNFFSRQVFCYNELMQLLEEITSDEMIGEFLKAELHSSRFRRGSLRALKMLGYNERLLENPNYGDATQNEKRAKVLGLCRGWPDAELFTNFPSDTHWYRINFSINELKRVYRLKSSSDMADSERSLLATARHVMNGQAVHNINNELIYEIRKKIEAKEQLPPIIIVAAKQEGKKILVEGHSRGVAYCSFESLNYDIPAIMGISNDMNDWAYF